MRRPVADADRGSLKRSLRAHAVLERREIDEGLEGGAGLAQRLGRAVELALGIVAAADHGAHRAVGRHGDERACSTADLAPSFSSVAATAASAAACIRASSVVRTTRSRPSAGT